MRILCIGLLACTLTACKPKFEPNNVVDPLNASFARKGWVFIRELHCRNDSCSDSFDVLQKYEFDKDLNLIFENSLIDGYGSNDYTRYAYDNRHFVTRYQGFSFDRYSSILFAYKMDAANRALYQRQYDIDSQVRRGLEI